jgi:alpha-tubulin suppressor-like RCC1 family protein
LGVRGAGKDYRSPAPVVGLKGIKVVKVGCGDFHSVALSTDGKLYSWGGGGNFFNRGQCGQGHNKDSESPELIKALDHKFIAKLSCGGYHTLALSDDNELFAWGAGLYGECGHGLFSHTNTPKTVKFTSAQSNGEVKVSKYKEILGN